MQIRRSSDTVIAAATTDPFCHAFVASNELVAAVRNGDLETARWICDEYCPHVVPVKAVAEAAALDKLCILQWFFARHPGATPNEHVW